MTIKQIVSDVKSAKLKPTDLVRKALENIQKTQELNIFIQVLGEQALKQAQDVEAKVNQNQALGKLAGVIFCVKDNFLVKDTLTTAASSMLSNFKAPYTASSVEKLLNEDAILIGKVNLDSFAHGTSTENSYFKATKNPHDDSLTPGGSSGGSAVAVATNICQFALGTDTGGSVRLPASFCGVMGFKPTYGLISRYGVVAMASSTDCISPLGHNLEDIDLLLEILKGRDDLDGTTLSNVSLNTNLEKPIKVAAISEFKSNLDKQVEAPFHQSLQDMQAMGWQVSDISIKHIELALACYYILVSAEVSSNLSRYSGLLYGKSQADTDWQELIVTNRSLGFMPENKRRIMLGTYVLSQGYYEAYYQKAQKLRTLLVQQFDQAFDNYHALVSPVSPSTAFKLGSKTNNPVQMYLADLMTVAPSLAGIPAVSIPLKTTGLPVGLQIMTQRKTDGLTLKLAQEFMKNV